MAQNVQNVTLSLTLPITCHICLGKVRKPVICVNYHVFCSVCIEVWLRNNNQCPACRVPITPENPCKDIIGGTGENECVFTHTVRKHLRKTRLELLHREYEDEIESLEKEVEELKVKNLSLESQLKIALDPQSLTASNEKEGTKENADEAKGSSDPKTVEEWAKKLAASNEISVQIRDDLEKLKEVNKKLRTENCGFVRENMRLKAEVDSKSSQKFGRFTVAALQSKVDQHERETNQLKKALERSDEYIEELESQVAQLKKTAEEHKRCMKGEPSSGEVNDSSKECMSLKIKSQDITPTLQSTSQSSDNLEQPLLSGLQDDSMMCINSSSPDTSNGSDSLCPLDKEMFSSSQEDLLDTVSSTAIMNTTLHQPWENKLEELMQNKGGNICAFPALDTPTMSLSSLQLNTPNDKSPSKSGTKCSAYLRKPTFDFPSETPINDNIMSTENNNSSLQETSYGAKNKMFWNYSQSNPNTTLDFRNSEQNVKTVEPAKASSILNDKASQFLFKKLQAISEAEIDCARTSSEASMDAAYLDKISELDSMMSESENKSPFRFRSAELSSASKTSRTAKHKETGKLLEKTTVKADKCSESSNKTSSSEEWKPINFSVMSPTSLQMNENFPLFADETSDPDEIVPLKSCFQQEHSSDFLFEDDQKSESCFIHETDGDRPPWAASFVAEERSRSNSHSTKRKIQGSLSSASPSKNLKN